MTNDNTNSTFFLFFLFRDVTLRYNEAVNVLKRELLGALSESLGLQSSFIDDLCGEFQKSNSNYYPPCPEPQYAFGARPHSDPTTITLLLQDHVGGLEVRDKHGEWMQVKPIPHAFVINLGDQLEVRVNNHHKLLLLLMRRLAAATLIFLSIVRCELDICCNTDKTCSTCKQATQEYRRLVEDPAFLHFLGQRIVMYVATGINLVLLAC